MCPANETRRYIVTSALTGWAHTENDPCLICFSYFTTWKNQQCSLFSCIPFQMRWNIVYCNQGPIQAPRYIAFYMTSWNETVMRSCGRVSRGPFAKWYKSRWLSIVHLYADMNESKRQPLLMPSMSIIAMTQPFSAAWLPVAGSELSKREKWAILWGLLLWNMQNGAIHIMTTNQPVLWPWQRHLHVVIPPIAQAVETTNTVIKLGKAV